MNIVVYGATGNSGSRIVQELIARGHKVTAVLGTLLKWRQR